MNEKRREKLKAARDAVNAELAARGKTNIKVKVVRDQLILLVDEKPLVRDESIQ